jgi:hypothetical protein
MAGNSRVTVAPISTPLNAGRALKVLTGIAPERYFCIGGRLGTNKRTRLPSR